MCKLYGPRSSQYMRLANHNRYIKLVKITEHFFVIELNIFLALH